MSIEQLAKKPARTCYSVISRWWWFAVLGVN